MMKKTLLLSHVRPFQTPLVLPPSINRQWVVLLGLAAMAICVAIALWFEVNAGWIVPIAMVSYVLPILAIEHLPHLPHELMQFQDGWQERTLSRTIALYLTFALMLLLAWVMPWYETYFMDGLFDSFSPITISAAGVLLLVATPLYLSVTDEQSDTQVDGALALGAWISGKRDLLGQTQAIKLYALGWGIKFFFIPIMLNFAWESADSLSNWDWPLLTTDSFTTADGFSSFYETALQLIFFIDYIIVVVGYCFMLRLFNTQLRSADQTGLGWSACLVCYGPLWTAFYAAYFAYGNESYWQGAFEDMPLFLSVLWGSVILLLNIIYVWCTLSFGLRFSNLTNRGIITNGPYRYFKHPAYLVKNISFWLLSVPFIPTAGFMEAVKVCVLLVLVNLLYYVRAKTEEQHLRNDPDYVAYEAWMAQNSILAKASRAWAAF
jgi:isoprenylcysteine carboxyl methyltransferase (ICMT) family protein YpbQ